jgi:hypothetical protein
MGSHACLNPARTRRAWRVTHASIQHVHTDLSRCGGWLQKAVPLPAQSSHLCVNQQVWRFALTRRLALSARTLVAPACRLCMWCAVQSGSGTPAHWHHVRRELDRTRRLGPTRPIREWHSCYTGIMFAANLIGPGDSDRLGHSMCRGVSTTPSARRTAHTRDGNLPEPHRTPWTDTGIVCAGGSRPHRALGALHTPGRHASCMLCSNNAVQPDTSPRLRA